MSDAREVEVSVDDLMLEIREEVARRRAGRQRRVALQDSASPGLSERSRYSLSDFLYFHDEDFVRNAYLGILRREPDPAGAADYLSDLRSGRRSKVEIIKALRFSPEGRAIGVPIIGLREHSCFQVASIPNLRAPRIDPKEAYSVADFMVLQDEAFVRNAYVCLLRREPDPSGLTEFLNRLRTGQVSRIEVLGALRYSREGKAASVPVRGLAMRYRIRRLHRIPVIGRAIAIGEYAARLPDLVRHHERLEAAVFQLRAETADTVRQLESDIESLSSDMAIREQVAAMRERLGRLTAELEDVSARQDSLASLSRVEELAEELEATRQRAITREEQARALAELEQRIERKRVEADHALDAFYASFEDRFRGTEEEIRQRVEVYLPIVRDASAGSPTAPILDVGCGRGEWLELLRDSGLSGRGVDLNQTMIERCRRRGLEVIEGDAIEYMRRLEGASLGAVTGMHVIEHIPFPRLVELFDEVLRVLVPGGVAIFETPNPENLRVGACNFHFDPTHIRPLPPESTKFVAEARGFARVEILRLHPYPTQPPVSEGDIDNTLREVVSQALFGSQDYAMVAHKASSPGNDGFEERDLSR